MLYGVGIVFVFFLNGTLLRTHVDKLGIKKDVTMVLNMTQELVVMIRIGNKC